VLGGVQTKVAWGCDCGRVGISDICAEWQTFPPFYDWAMANGYADDLTIDRKYSCRGFSPENCEWVTESENSRRAQQNVWRQTTHRRKC